MNTILWTAFKCQLTCFFVFGVDHRSLCKAIYFGEIFKALNLLADLFYEVKHTSLDEVVSENRS